MNLRAFWQIWVLRNLGTKVISIVIASLLWLFVLGSKTEEETRRVSIRLVTPTDLVPSNDLPDKVNVTVEGPKAILSVFRNEPEEPIQIELKRGRPGMVFHTISRDAVRVPVGVRVVEVQPETIQIRLEYRRRREVPVKVDLRGIPASGFRVGRVEVEPAVVPITGPESQVDDVREVLTDPLDISGANAPAERELSLGEVPRHNVLVEAPSVKAHVEIIPAFANFRVKNVDIRVLSSYKSTLTEKTVTVMVRSDSRDLKLDGSQVFAVVDLRGKPRGKYREPVKVTLPENVFLVKVIPERVNVTLH